MKKLPLNSSWVIISGHMGSLLFDATYRFILAVLWLSYTIWILQVYLCRLAVGYGSSHVLIFFSPHHSITWDSSGVLVLWRWFIYNKSQYLRTEMQFVFSSRVTCFILFSECVSCRHSKFIFKWLHDQIYS